MSGRIDPDKLRGLVERAREADAKRIAANAHSDAGHATPKAADEAFEQALKAAGVAIIARENLEAAAVNALPALLDELERLRGAQWKPIDTLPNDGREVLVGTWVGQDGDEPVWSSWTTICDGGPLGCDGTYGDPATHWMDPPAPPSLNSLALGREVNP